MKLLIQPGDGIAPLLKGIQRAKRSVEIAIFRFSLPEIEAALTQAANRGVAVHALIAYTNRGDEKGLRKLEMRLLAEGVTVSRTANDLARYHGKYIIIDRRDLYLLAFNFTRLDIDRTRSFGVITSNRKIVSEAVKLFEADTTRQPYTNGNDAIVVSPINARKQLSAFIKGAKRELLIYDPKISDPAMIRLLEDRSQKGVEVKIIGKLTKKCCLLSRKLQGLRLHTRTILRDGHKVFVGSQSLREMELDERREVGLIFGDRKIAKRMVETFQRDWGLIEEVEKENSRKEKMPAARVAKKVAKAVVKELPSVASALQATANGVSADKVLRQTVREVLKQVIEQEAAVK